MEDIWRSVKSMRHLVTQGMLYRYAERPGLREL